MVARYMERGEATDVLLVDLGCTPDQGSARRPFVVAEGRKHEGSALTGILLVDPKHHHQLSDHRRGFANGHGHVERVRVVNGAGSKEEAARVGAIFL